MSLKYYLLCFALLSKMALGQDQKCFSSVVCNVEGSENHQTSWIQIFPLPKCSGETDARGKLVSEYEKSLESFIQALNDNTSSALASSSEKGSGRCFMPVVCTKGQGSLTDWLRVYGDSCEEGITDDASRQIFNNYTTRASEEVTNKAKSICVTCTAGKFDAIFGTSNTPAQGEPDECFAPVVCSESEKTNENWMKVYPPGNCGKTPTVTTIEVSRAKRAYDKALLQAIEVYRDIETKGCAAC